uniref:Ring finger protein 130 n=2 Tax=Leptobrachium leishanense TaxID=445787 RepID=A0A8C5Q7H9_9ANUR
MIPKHYLYLNCLPILVLLHSTLVHSASDTTNMEFFNAVVNITIQDPSTNLLLQRIDGGRYGLDSPKTEVKGVLITPMPNHGVNGLLPHELKHVCVTYIRFLLLLLVDRQGCDPQTRFHVPPNTKHWIAFLQRGNCTFKEKILRAASHNASAVVIYNNISKEEHVTMTHAGTGDIVAIIVSESTGRDILSYVERNISVLMAIAVGSRSPPKGFSRGSLVFVSISFIVLMIISSAWLIFYFIQKIRYTSARDRNQRRLGDAAKKAIGKLTTRTVKKGDKETDPDFDHCAVCIESYKHNDIVRVLPCKHVFHKLCVDPWLSEHCTCPMCKLNILKALGIVANVPCTDNVAFDMERLTRGQSANHRSAPNDPTEEGTLILESLRSSVIPQLPQDGEVTPRTGEINIAVTKEWFIIASFGLLSALTLCYMIIKATASLYATEIEWS